MPAVRRLPVAGLALALAVAGCGGANDGSAASIDPPPTTDPGPNPTTPGLEVVRGTLVLDEPTCTTLDADDGRRFDLRLARLTRVGAELVDPGGRVVAREGDTMIVSGFPRDAAGPCGIELVVDAVVSVNPPAG